MLELTGGAQWEALGRSILDLTPFDNSKRLLYDIEQYGVDACVLLPAFGMTNDLNEVSSVRISQDDLNLIIGGNASRLYGLDSPHRRLFRE